MATILNIRTNDEGQLATLLLAHSFCSGVTKTFASTAAIALFIDQFGSENLPYTYIGLAVGISLVGYIYTKLEIRLPFQLLLVTNLSVLLVILCIFRLLLMASNTGGPVMALMIWGNILSVLLDLEFWGMAGRLFNLRQGKRLFGLIGAGEMIAVIISGFTINYLVNLMGTPNLLLIAIAGLVGSLGLLLYIIRLYNDRLSDSDENERSAQDQEAASARESPSFKDLFKNRYSILIFSAAALASTTFFFVDNAFYNEVQGRYTEAQLAIFMGNFLALGNMLALIARIFISAPFVERYGLSGGLLSVPLPVAFGAMLVVLFGAFLESGPAIFWPVIIIKLFDYSSRSSIYSSVELILYQPFSVKQRTKILTVVASLINPLMGGVAGLTLLFLIKRLSFGTIQLYSILLVLLMIWSVIIILLSREYTGALLQALSKHRLRGGHLSLTDGVSIDVLKRWVESSNTRQMIYALHILEEIEHESFGKFLRRALSHPAPEARVYSLRQIQRRGLTSTLGAVRRIVKSEQAPDVRAAAVETLAMLGDEAATVEIEPCLYHSDPQIRQGVLVGWLRSGEIERVITAGQLLLGFIHAGDRADRLFAAEILGRADVKSFYRALLSLLQDEDVAVRRVALTAAGKLKSPKLWPAVVAALSSPDLSTPAALALQTGGEAVVPALRTAWERAGQPRQTLIRLARICSQIGGQQTTRLLLDRVDHPDGAVRSQILMALSGCGYQVDRSQETDLIHKRIRAEVEAAAWLLAALVDIGQDKAVESLTKALWYELKQSQARLLWLLSFVYDKKSILQAREALLGEHISAEKRAYGLEIMTILISKELKQILSPLFDDLTSPDKPLEKLASVFPQARLDRIKRLAEIIALSDARLNPWTIACALNVVGQLSLKEMAPTVVESLDASDPLIRETALWTLVKLDPDRGRQYAEALTDAPSPRLVQVGRYLQTVRDEEKIMMLSTVEKVFVLKIVDIFAEIPEEALVEAASVLEQIEVKAGETIIEKGRTDNCLYIIFDGRVCIHDGQQTLAELGELDIFGEMSLLDSLPHTASATALEDTYLLRLDQGPFYELVVNQADVARGIIRVLSQRIRALNQKVVALSEVNL